MFMFKALNQTIRRTTARGVENKQLRAISQHAERQ
jgi:hypothetical protein